LPHPDNWAVRVVLKSNADARHVIFMVSLLEQIHVIDWRLIPLRPPREVLGDNVSKFSKMKKKVFIHILPVS
jgi:hypothetical protein